MVWTRNRVTDKPLSQWTHVVFDSSFPYISKYPIHHQPLPLPHRRLTPTHLTHHSKHLRLRRTTAFMHHRPPLLFKSFPFFPKPEFISTPTTLAFPDPTTNLDAFGLRLDLRLCPYHKSSSSSHREQNSNTIVFTTLPSFDLALLRTRQVIICRHSVSRTKTWCDRRLNHTLRNYRKWQFRAIYSNPRMHLPFSYERPSIRIPIIW